MPARDACTGRRRVSLVTLGCPKNEADSARLATLLGRRFDVVDEPAEADVVVVNTCGFIEDAVSESLDALVALSRLPEAPLVVAAGCLVSRYGHELAAALPEAGLSVPLEDLHRLDELVEDALSAAPAASAIANGGMREPTAQRPHGARARELWTVPPTASGPTAYLTISDGCRRACSYCAIPAIRGGFTSRPPGDVLDEGAALAAAGAREVVLVGQDTAAYGTDLARDAGGPWDLARLLEALDAQVGASAWLRLLYLQPDSVDDRLLATIAAHPSICRYLDVPIQHADDGVLAAMRRSGGEERIREVLRRIRAALPNAVLRTTVMVGFPGEDARAFQRLERLVGEGWFDYVGVFAYSAERGTPAADLPGTVRADVKRRRKERLGSLQDAVWARGVTRLVEKEIEVLVEGPSDDPSYDWMGRWRGQAPDVDGVVYWSGPRPGPFARVRVESAAGYDLLGVAVA